MARRVALRRRARRLRLHRSGRRTLPAHAGFAARRPRHARRGGIRGRLVLPLARAAVCRSTSIRSTRASTTSSSGSACAASSPPASTQSSATPFRSHAQPPLSGQWRTGPWHLRDERMYLVPGDSPMGYRLPLDSLPWVSEADYPYLREHDPMEPRQPLPHYAPLGAGPVPPRVQPPIDRAPARGESADWIVRTALCTEVRDGVLYVFLPPVPDADDYLRARGGDRSDRGQAVDARAPRRLRTAVRSTARAVPDHARPGRDRGERSAGVVVGVSSSSRRRPFTRRRVRRG